MCPSKRLRRWVSGWLLLAMLSMQLAVAAHACPLAAHTGQSVAAAMAQMPDCEEMDQAADPAQAPLCKAHCSNDAQSAARALMPDLQPDPASIGLLVRVLEPPPELPLLHIAGHPRSPVPRGDSLPLYLALQVLRN